MKLVAGRDFYITSKVDSNNTLINEALAKQLGKQGRIGGIISALGQNNNVIGIIKDFVYNDMYGTSAPFIAFCNPQNVNDGCLTIRFKPNTEITKAFSATEKIIKQNNPGYPFEYKFVDEEFDKLFKTETLIGQLANVFAVLAIFISCFGLFGLAAYTASEEQKKLVCVKYLVQALQALQHYCPKIF